MKGTARWMLAVAVSGAAFVCCWWVCQEPIGLDEGKSLGIAGAVVAIVAAVMVYWAPQGADKRTDERAEADDFIARFNARRSDVPQSAPMWSGQVYAENIGRSPIYDVVLYFPTLSISGTLRRGDFHQTWAFIRVCNPGKGRIQGLQRAVADLHKSNLGYNLAALTTDVDAADGGRSVRPGQSISVVVPVKDRRLLDARGWILRFTDAHGRRWFRELSTNQLISSRKAHRIMRPLMGQELKFSVHNPPKLTRIKRDGN